MISASGRRASFKTNGLMAKPLVLNNHIEQPSVPYDRPRRTPLSATRTTSAAAALRLLCCGWLAWVVPAYVGAQQRPLLTEDVDIVETGWIRLQAGAGFFQNQRFGLSGLRGDLYRPVMLGAHFGLNTNVGFSIEGSLRDYLSIRERGPSAIPLAVAPGAVSTGRRWRLHALDKNQTA